MNDEPVSDREKLEEQEAEQLDRQIGEYGNWLAEACDKLKEQALSPNLNHASYASLRCERVTTLAYHMRALGQVADDLRRPRRIRIEQEQHKEPAHDR